MRHPRDNPTEVMRCQACETLHLAGPHGAPHAGLLAKGPRKRFRALFKAPINVSYYQCAVCDTWWLHEDNPSHAVDAGWMLLGQEKSLLKPRRG